MGVGGGGGNQKFFIWCFYYSKVKIFIKFVVLQRVFDKICKLMYFYNSRRILVEFMEVEDFYDYVMYRKNYVYI